MSENSKIKLKKKKTGEDRIPGDLTKEQMIEQMIRVNHAGEYGAKKIYEGQLSAIKDKETFDLVKHMAEQEEEHLKFFEKELLKRNIRPTALLPVWHVAGYMLGKVTALIDKKVAMACTVAIEEVIDEHYQEQIKELGEDEKNLKKNIEKFRNEELEHRDIGLENQAKEIPGYFIFSSVIKIAGKAAIKIAKIL